MCGHIIPSREAADDRTAPKQAYARLGDGLKACCRQQLSQCLASSPQSQSHQAAAPAAAERCAARFAPQEITLPALGDVQSAPQPASAEAVSQLRDAWLKSSAPLRAQACQEQLRHLISSNTDIVLECTADAQGQRHCTKKEVRAENAAELRARFVQESGDQQKEFARLRGELRAATAVRPGWEELAAFPAGQASGELTLLGGLVLLGGAGLGLLAQPSLRGRWRGAAAGALSAGLAFLGLIALLPDTRRPYLLSALAGAALAATLLAFWRVFRLRRRDRPAPLPS